MLGQVLCSKSAWQESIKEKEEGCLGPRWRWSKEACVGARNDALRLALAGQTLCDPTCLPTGREGAQRRFWDRDVEMQLGGSRLQTSQRKNARWQSLFLRCFS